MAHSDLKLTVLAGFREAEDVCCKDAVQRLCVLHPERFECAYVISSTDGRISSDTALASIADIADTETHFHLIGNGAIPKRSDTSSSGWPNSLHGPRRNRDIDGQFLHLILRHASRLVRTTQLPQQIMVHRSPTDSTRLAALESTNMR